MKLKTILNKKIVLIGIVIACCILTALFLSFLHNKEANAKPYDELIELNMSKLQNLSVFSDESYSEVTINYQTDGRTYYSYYNQWSTDTDWSTTYSSEGNNIKIACVYCMVESLSEKHDLAIFVASFSPDNQLVEIIDAVVYQQDDLEGFSSAINWNGKTLDVDKIIDPSTATGEVSFVHSTTPPLPPVPSHTATFKANGGAWEDGSTNKDISEDFFAPWIFPQTEPILKGYKFIGWYLNGAKLSTDDYFVYEQNVEVEAHWVEAWTITYDSNGGEGDKFSETVEKGQSYTLNSGESFSKEGQVITAWNTKPDDSGTMYDVVYTITPTEDINLYAHWADAETCSFTFKIYGQRGYVTELYNSINYNTDDVYNFEPIGTDYQIQMVYNSLAANEYSIIVQTYRGNFNVFLDCFYEAMIFAPQNYYISKIIVNGQLLTWSNPSAALKVNENNIIEVYDNGTTPVPYSNVPISSTFNAAGGYWPDVNGASQDITQHYLTEINFPTTDPAKQGLHFKHWTDGETQITAESIFEYMNNGTTFDANWVGFASFDANGGQGQVDPFEYYEGDEVTMYDGSNFTWDNHKLIGWNTKSDGTGTFYEFDDTFNMSTDTTLYAVWAEIPTPPIPPIPPTPGGEDINNTSASAQTGDVLLIRTFIIVALIASGVFLARKVWKEKVIF